MFNIFNEKKRWDFVAWICIPGYFLFLIWTNVSTQNIVQNAQFGLTADIFFNESITYLKDCSYIDKIKRVPYFLYGYFSRESLLQQGQFAYFYQDINQNWKFRVNFTGFRRQVKGIDLYCFNSIEMYLTKSSLPIQK